jgi:hypothetical protein
LGHAHWYVSFYEALDEYVTGQADLLLFSAGEMFDLERLVETCKKLNRWTFFVSSAPLNMPGGISSPPNAQAIF